MPKRCKFNNKVIYDTKRQAREVKKSAWKNNHKRLKFYPCPFGNHYHLTSTSSGVNQTLKTELLRSRIERDKIIPDDSGLYHVLYKGIWHLCCFNEDELLILGKYVYDEKHKMIWMDNNNKESEDGKSE